MLLDKTVEWKDWENRSSQIVGWPNVGRTSVLSSWHWPNVRRTYIASGILVRERKWDKTEWLFWGIYSDEAWHHVEYHGPDSQTYFYPVIQNRYFACLRPLKLLCSNRITRNRPISLIPEHTCSISHNAPFRTETNTFLFWMEHGIWNRCILGFVN